MSSPYSYVDNVSFNTILLLLFSAIMRYSYAENDFNYNF